MVTQWGVNIDGADFKRLRTEYSRLIHTVPLWSIAAAVMLACEWGCVIWHFRVQLSHEAQRQGKDGFEDRPPARQSRKNLRDSPGHRWEMEGRTVWQRNYPRRQHRTTVDGNCRSRRDHDTAVTLCACRLIDDDDEEEEEEDF
ncbi:hypothetical protein C0Q70_06062 [Pomacea canaliculata]|uniref:Uncharacterized protein n=1 Tax=Pomacea canaliculata TaxID=400727 RepID=A0A2T7PMZ2_POMCA|nr:hypothetical protein C0Q70_06062 [Pomacea canaliculata]